MIAVSIGEITGSSPYDFATVVYQEVLSAVSIDLIPTGVRLRFTGVPGRIYSIERAPTVTGPWSAINTQRVPHRASSNTSTPTLPRPPPFIARANDESRQNQRKLMKRTSLLLTCLIGLASTARGRHRLSQEIPLKNN
jgi:hypothetical protein